MDKKFWKKWQSRTLTATGQVFEGEGYVKNVIITNDGSGNADAVLYDGHNTNGVMVLPMRAPTHGMKPLPLSPPMVITQGLYLDVGSNVEGVLIQFLECVKK